MCVVREEEHGRNLHGRFGRNFSEKINIFDWKPPIFISCAVRGTDEGEGSGGTQTKVPSLRLSELPPLTVYSSVSLSLFIFSHAYAIMNALHSSRGLSFGCKFQSLRLNFDALSQIPQRLMSVRRTYVCGLRFQGALDEVVDGW